MSKARNVLVSIFVLAIITLGWRMNFPLFGAQADEKTEQTVEYKVVRATELGLVIKPRIKALDQSAFEQELNKLAADGWEWKEFVPAENMSFVVFDRRK